MTGTTGALLGDPASGLADDEEAWDAAMVVFDPEEAIVVAGALVGDVVAGALVGDAAADPPGTAGVTILPTCGGLPSV